MSLDAARAATDAALVNERQVSDQATAEQAVQRAAAEARVEVLEDQVTALQVENLALKKALEECDKPEPPPDDVIYRDTFANGQHSPSDSGFFYKAPAAGSGSRFVFTTDESGRDVFRLEISGDGDDNRNEQRFGGFGKKTKLFVGFKRRMSPNFTHEDRPGPDNWKQLRLFSDPYETAGGIHVGFSLLARANNDPAGSLLIEASSNTVTGAVLYPCPNKGTWDRVAVPGLDERWGFWVELASGPNMKDGKITMWYQGVDITTRSSEKTGFNWNALDLWNYMPNGRNYFDAGFYPGWDNAGSTNPEYLDYHEFVLADQILPDYTA
jgi:hypothetical protein